MNTDDLILLETARQEIYSGLSTCFCLPGTHLPTAIGHLKTWVALLGSDAGEPVSRMASAISAIKDFTDLKIEFSRLFVGPYSRLAPPLGSAYMEESGTMMSESTLDAVARYREAGLEIDVSFNEAPDHVVAELEFLSFLIGREVETLRSESDEVPQTFLSRQKDFLTHHLGSWIAPFSERIIKNSTSLFYRNLANAIEIIVKEDIDYLNTPGLSEQAASPPA